MNNRVPTFVMMVGLPASGKSTYAKELAEEMRAVICSSDAIRKELYGDENSQDNNEEVFKLLHSRIKECLKKGVNVIYDATNINSKRRRAFLSELRNIPCTKRCVVMTTPFKECCERNDSRDRVVPYEVIERMYKNWNTPYWFEGWDEIEVVDNNILKTNIDDWLSSVMDFDQDSPYHTMTLGKHCEVVGNTLKDNTLLYLTGILHDCGKPFCRQNRDIEIFKPIKNFEGLYEISNYGKVKSIRTGNFLKIRDNGKGYLYVDLSEKGITKRFYVHRLVAQHFVDIPCVLTNKEKLDVNHIDSNKQNNFWKNLEWCTRSKNQLHAFKTNEDRNVIGFDKYNAKLSVGEVKCIHFIKEHTNYTNEKIGEMFGIDRGNVSKILNGKKYLSTNNVFEKEIAPILPVEKTTYYQHHCVGAYDSLFFAYPENVSRLDVSILINLHMMPYFWEKDEENGEKTKQKYQRLWGNELYNNIITLHIADKNAH